MKINFTFLMLAACCVFTLNAQVLITQNFNNPSTLTASGWVIINRSSPLGITSWFPGNAGVFPAYSSPDSTYLAANFNSTTGGNGTISNWLITPTVTVNNGGVLQFATRTNTVGAAQMVSPDRLQVYLSTGTGTDVGTSATTVGTFSTLLVSVNPSLTATGYPTSWTVYTATLSGVTGTLAGRFGFRYSVPSAGPTGTNSSYIGIDNVRFELPCPNPTLSITSSTTGICSGGSFSVTASGATSYTYSTGQTTASVILSPLATTIYTLTASSIPNCNSSATIAITVTQTPVLAISDVTVCAGTGATLSASGASSYSWSTGAISPIIVVTPSMSTNYTLTGYNGNCASSHLVAVTIGASLSINASSQQSLICSGSSATIMATGASSYSYSPVTFSGNVGTPSIVVSPSINTVFTINGSVGSCFGTNTILISVNPAPSLSVAPLSDFITCVNSPLTFTASGAASYSLINSTSIGSIYSITTPSVTGTYTYGIVGTATNGCNSTAIVNATVNLCTVVETHNSAEKEVSVYPNPFTNYLCFSGLSSGSAELYNALGQMVAREIISAPATLGTADLLKGFYIIKMYSDDRKLVGTVKVLKN